MPDRYDAPFHVRADDDLADLVPTYLGRRADDVEKITDALASDDFEAVRFVGHSMKGSGAGYGFDGLTEIGARLEIAGRDEDGAAAADGLRDLKDYLANVQVDYD